jgi:hypothetical protein
MGTFSTFDFRIFVIFTHIIMSLALSYFLDVPPKRFIEIILHFPIFRRNFPEISPKFPRNLTARDWPNHYRPCTEYLPRTELRHTTSKMLFALLYKHFKAPYIFYLPGICRQKYLQHVGFSAYNDGHIFFECYFRTCDVT